MPARQLPPEPKFGHPVQDHATCGGLNVRVRVRVRVWRNYPWQDDDDDVPFRPSATSHEHDGEKAPPLLFLNGNCSSQRRQLLQR